MPNPQVSAIIVLGVIIVLGWGVTARALLTTEVDHGDVLRLRAEVAQLRLDLMATDQMAQASADQIERIVSTTGATETTPQGRRLGE